MKGNARIIVFVGIVLIILLIVLLNMTVFTVKDVSVLNEVESQFIDADKILLDSGIKLGTNIFALSERKTSERIELANSYLEVVAIERKFPNKVIIHVSVRIPLMAIKIKDSDSYAVVDGSLKILERVDSTSSLYQTCTKVEGIEVTNFEIGNFLDKKNTYNARLNAISYVAENEMLNGIAFMNFFESISFNSENDVAMVKLRSGVTICLKGEYDAESKFRYALELYRHFGEQSFKRNSGYIYFKSSGEEMGWDWSETNPY